MHPLFQKISELRKSRDGWRSIADSWESLCRALNDECDDARSAVKVQTMLARTYLRERDKLVKRVERAEDHAAKCESCMHSELERTADLYFAEKEKKVRLQEIFHLLLQRNAELRNALEEVLCQDGDLIGDKSKKAINNALQ